MYSRLRLRISQYIKGQRNCFILIKKCVCDAVVDLCVSTSKSFLCPCKIWKKTSVKLDKVNNLFIFEIQKFSQSNRILI